MWLRVVRVPVEDAVERLAVKPAVQRQVAPGVLDVQICAGAELHDDAAADLGEDGRRAGRELPGGGPPSVLVSGQTG